MSQEKEVDLRSKVGAEGEIGDNKNGETQEGLKIKFPEDISTIKALQAKLTEYKERLATQVMDNPYKAPELFADANYKIAVMENILLNGGANINLLPELLKTRDGFFDADIFRNACEVIEDYIKTGGREVFGGTGLKLDREEKGTENPLGQRKDSGHEEDLKKIEQVRDAINGKREENSENILSEVSWRDIREKYELMSDNEKKLFDSTKSYEIKVGEINMEKNECKISEGEYRQKEMDEFNATLDIHNSLTEKIKIERHNEIVTLAEKFAELSMLTSIADATSFADLYKNIRKLHPDKAREKYNMIPNGIIIQINRVRKNLAKIESLPDDKLGIKNKVRDFLELKIDTSEPEPDLPSDAEWLTEEDIKELGVNFREIRPYSIDAPSGLRERLGEYPEIGSYGLNTEFGQINGRLIWCDGNMAIFETPQGKIKMPFKKLVASSGKTYEEIENKWKDEEHHRKYTPKARYM